MFRPVIQAEPGVIQSERGAIQPARIVRHLVRPTSQLAVPVIPLEDAAIQWTRPMIQLENAVRQLEHLGFQLSHAPLWRDELRESSSILRYNVVGPCCRTAQIFRSSFAMNERWGDAATSPYHGCVYSESSSAGSTQNLSLGFNSTSGNGSDFDSSNGANFGSGAPSSLRCLRALVSP